MVREQLLTTYVIRLFQRRVIIINWGKPAVEVNPELRSMQGEQARNRRSTDDGKVVTSLVVEMMNGSWGHTTSTDGKTGKRGRHTVLRGVVICRLALNCVSSTESYQQRERERGFHCPGSFAHADPLLGDMYSADQF